MLVGALARMARMHERVEVAELEFDRGAHAMSWRQRRHGGG